MFLQITRSQLNQYMPFIMIGVLLLVGVLIFAIALAITKADVKTNTKWVFGSFFIQFALIFFISTPMILGGVTGEFSNGGPDPGTILPTVIFSAFIDVQVVNIIHKLGMKRSLIVVLLIIIPITFAMYLLGSNMENLIRLL